MEIISQPLRQLRDKPVTRRFRLPRLKHVKTRLLTLISKVRLYGYNPAMEEYEQRKLAIFNQLNFFQLISGIIIPLAGLISTPGMRPFAWMAAFLPALVSVVVLFLNKRFKHEAALLAYFSLYPFVTCIVFMSGINAGIGLSFMLYGVLAVFFLRDIGYIIFSLCFSMVSYFILIVVLKHHRYDLEQLNNGLYLVNHGIMLAFIFYGLFLVKKENTVYQFSILGQNRELHQKNIQIQQQADQLQENASQLEQQAAELAELNAVKSKLFSIISHDLKAPLYALRNLFREVHQKNMTATELKKTVPDILNDLNYTVGLMDNLLQWSKAQMESNSVHPQPINIQESINETMQLLHLQAKSKNIHISNCAAEGVYGYADRDMIQLVLRNLLSNAIKFTPDTGNIFIGTHEHPSFLEVYVRDSGTGMNPESIALLNNNNYFTTKGTASESGTGLGLMLCKEFLARNGGKLHIESEAGKGSVFSFTLPKAV